jgi:hypothetical protein
MTAYYQEHGRYNVASYAALIAKWQIWGADSRPWQLARAVQMMAIVVGTYALLRRLARSTAAACAGAGLLLVGTGSAATWGRLTTGEPMGVLCLLVCAHCAIGLGSSPRWLLRSLTIAIAAATLILAKEALVVTIPFVALLPVLHPAKVDASAVVSWRRRVAVCVALTSVASALALLPVALTLLGARASGFVSNYNASHLGAPAFLKLLATMLFPIRLEEAIAGGLRTTAVLGDTMYGVTLMLGWGIAVLTTGRRAVAQLAAAAWLPVAMAVLYLPWPIAMDFYLLPALVGDAVLVAFALDHVRERAALFGKAAWATYACFGLAALLIAYQRARQTEAARIVDARVAAAIGDLASRTAVVVAVRDADVIPPPNQWMGKGPTLGRDASVLVGRELLPVTDVTCPYATALVRRGIPVFVYDADCGRLPVRAVPYRAYYRYFDPQRRAVTLDSVRADLLVTAERDEPASRE